ncbi:hypothetical protein BaRGS_00008297 [Batillaria attramentaria]|uniref:RING-type domain-containing protein n=1 Tax=Batillaria attramentaria TaxID=370345 RepID=A0ABD0LLL2_9CAEN
MGEEQKDHVKTNETVNRCIKCKCSLAAADKTSKLLPCLHTMCDDCVSGRTDVLERARKHKEEKEKESPEKEPKEEDQQGKEGKEEESEGKSKEEKEEDKTEPKNEEAENKEDTSKPHADTAVEEMQTGEPTPEPVPLTGESQI